jgi:hypothetical protein
MAITPNSFDFIEFINEGYASQQKYAEAAGIKGPLDDLSPDQRYSRIIEHLSHLIEEVIEARCFVPRRSWKLSEPSYLNDENLRAEFIAELFDVTLFFRSVLAYAGITGEEFAEISASKMGYNAIRKDHITNGTESAVQDPIAELKGDCPSSTFHHSV